ncbi:hypothetical protein HWV03_11805 [Moritella sp. 36]|uniref:hypothetical protein n=1 Tax=Moritella sp. 36 TaxID=2746233 RepID=UPI001BA7AB47|nr:hypothetical protein [Moritella sp. 36]QUM89433.1 hypothetical protein HWV03_11805 [Moritella sp. 36]
MDVKSLLSLIGQAETYFQQRERCFDNCWSTHLQLKQLDQQAAGWFYLLTQQGDALSSLDIDKPTWLDLLLAQTVTELVELVKHRTAINGSDRICLQWWSQRHNGAALIAALITLEATAKQPSTPQSLLTQELLCVIACATPVIRDQFNFLHVDNIKPCIHFINQHLGKASHIWSSHFLDAETTAQNSKKLLALSLCRGTFPVNLPVLSSALLSDKSLLKQYVVQADSRLVGALINELSAHNDNAKFVLSLMAFSGYKQFIPWLIQMLTAGFLSHAAFAALHTLLGADLETQLPAKLYGEYEPESQVDLLVALKQSLSDWWILHRDEFPERILAGKPINESNIDFIWQQGNISQCEVAAYHYWCMKAEHRLTDARGFNIGGML